KAEFAVAGAAPRACHVVEHPAKFAGRKIRVYDQPRFASDRLAVPGALQAVAELGCPAILPNGCVVNRLARSAIPHYRGFPSVGNAYGVNVAGLQTTLCHGRASHFQLT